METWTTSRSDRVCIGSPLLRNTLSIEAAADTLPLILIDDGEGDFRLPGLCDDIASGADDVRVAGFDRYRDEGDVVDEVDV